MLSDTVIAENSRLVETEPFEPEGRIDDAACIAQAIAERMSPEWRKCVDQEQRKRRLALSLSESGQRTKIQSK